ncbi:DUF262 domain-containing protein [Hyphomonas sp. L-53-1-40]|uniref:DUF262 domain-containing protein n=1 Tax=Hyphomonas sp. L-53-1-40 TaxID=1207058 RepID=UPI000AEDDECA|nr:DUF262 domain-containing protein [Hyphomonas sp. L-53-1-40]
MEPIRSRVEDVETMLSGYYFRPAAVQREYQWTVDQCGALFSDFVRAWTLKNRGADHPAASLVRGMPETQEATPYFLGTFVLRPDAEARFEVFDGLQRLTTLTILFAVMRDLVESFDKELHARLSLMVMDTKGQPHLNAGSADQTLANLIQKHSEAVRSRRNLSANTLRARLLSAAGLFRARLEGWSPETLAGFADYVLKNVLVGIVEVGDERLARQIFISTNNRGVPLNEADVLKSQVNSIPFRQDVAVKVLSGWTRIRDSFESDTDYTDFLYAVDFLTRREGRSSEGLTQLGEHLASTLSDDQILPWLEGFEDRAISWHWLSAIRENPKNADVTKGHVFQLFAFDWPEWRPVALELAGQLRRSLAAKDRRRVKSLTTRFSALHRACAAMTLEGAAEMDRVSVCLRALGDLQSGRNPVTHALVISDARLERISKILDEPAYDLPVIRQVFRWLEAPGHRGGNPDLLALVPRHILPANPEEFSEWEKDFPERDARWLLAHAWGNFALVTPGVDAGQPAMGGFKDWKKGLSKACAKLEVNTSLSKAQRWTASDISRRTDALRTMVLEHLRPRE